MTSFSQLIISLDESNTQLQVEYAAMQYFYQADIQELGLACCLLSGKCPEKLVSLKVLKSLFLQKSGIGRTLLEDAYRVSANWLETISLAWPNKIAGREYSLREMLADIISQKGSDFSSINEFVQTTWNLLKGPDRILFNRLITAGFNIRLPVNVLAKLVAGRIEKDYLQLVSDITQLELIHTLEFQNIFQEKTFQKTIKKPRPFKMAQLFAGSHSQIEAKDYLAEWLYRGTRIQVIADSSEVDMWSIEGELLSTKHEFLNSLSKLGMSFVLDGVLIDQSGTILVADKSEIVFGVAKANSLSVVLFDLLELNGRELTEFPLAERRQILKSLIDQFPENISQCLFQSPLLDYPNRSSIELLRIAARAPGHKGIILKLRESTYSANVNLSDWIFLPSEPFLVRLVLVYVQFIDPFDKDSDMLLTLAINSETNELLPVTRISLNEKFQEFLELRTWIIQNLAERFGPVYTVSKSQVFTCSFEKTEYNRRKKAGFELMKSQLIRWEKTLEAKDVLTKDEFIKRYESGQLSD